MPGVSITRRPSTSRLKAMVGLPRASSPTSRLITAFSVAGCFRNFRRAGVLKNNRSTVSRVPAEQPAGSAVSNSPPWMRTRNPPPPSRLRLTASTSATAAMLASASPRKPRVRIERRSSSARSLLVACRANATGRATGRMPWPSSTTSIKPWPAASTRTSIRAAPASIAFSASSLTTAAGRSTTSPAAMPSATAAERIAIRWPGSIPTSGRDMFPLPGVELFQRLSRREAFQVELLQLGDHRVIEWQAELGAGGRPFQGPLTLEFGEHLAGAHHDLARQAGQLRHMNTVAAVRAAFDHLVQENDPLPFLADLHPKVPQSGQALGERGQLVVVRRKQGERAQLGSVMQVFEDGLGDADSVVGAGSTPHLVENQQAPLRCMGQDVGGLHHLHHEGGESARQLVVGADPSKDAITEANHGALGGD